MIQLYYCFLFTSGFDQLDFLTGEANCRNSEKNSLFESSGGKDTKSCEIASFEACLPFIENGTKYEFALWYFCFLHSPPLSSLCQNPQPSLIIVFPSMC